MESYSDTWVRAEISQTIEVWHESAVGLKLRAHRYSPSEQGQREEAYDEALQAVEADLEGPGRIRVRDRMVASFGRFAAKALDLEGQAIDLLTQEFLPVGTELARRARQFDRSLRMDEIIQAARNAWTACGLQPLLGMPVTLTPSIFGYSLMYPYSDNYLDDCSIPARTKRDFSQRFRSRLLGDRLPPSDERENAIWKLIALVEGQYPRARYPQVFECLLAIHHAQEQSIGQLETAQLGSESEVLGLSCAKGGTSVLADACLARGSLSSAESRFAFEWGVLLQLGDDLQDLRDDLRRGSTTVFTRTVTSGKPLDKTALQLLNFSEKVGKRMDELPCGTAILKNLLKMSWRSLIIRAIADSYEFFSPEFVRKAERASPFRFDFLRRRSGRLAGRSGLYEKLFSDLAEDYDSSPDWFADEETPDLVPHILSEQP